MALITKPADSTQAAVEQVRGRTRWLQETLRFYLAQVRDASKKTGGRATLVAALGTDGPELEAVIGKVTPPPSRRHRPPHRTRPHPFRPRPHADRLAPRAAGWRNMVPSATGLVEWPRKFESGTRENREHARAPVGKSPGPFAAPPGSRDSQPLRTVVCTTPRGAGGHLPQTNPVPLTVNFRDPAGSFRLFSAAAPTSAQTALPR